MLKIGVLALLKNAVPLSTIRVTMPAILYTFTNVAFGTYNISPSSFEKFSTMENLYKYKEEIITITSNKNTTATFSLIALGCIRIVRFVNITIPNTYETIFSNIPPWFCQDTVAMIFSAANGSGGYGGEVSECHLDTTNRKIKFYPKVLSGTNNIELSGQCVTVSKSSV